MSYICDVCSAEMASKSSGRQYSNQEISTCPDYWKTVAKKQEAFIAMLGASEAENAYGLVVRTLTEGQGGFTVCKECEEMIAGRDRQLEEIGLGGVKSAGINDRASGFNHSRYCVAAKDG